VDPRVGDGLQPTEGSLVLSDSSAVLHLLKFSRMESYNTWVGCPRRVKDQDGGRFACYMTMSSLAAKPSAIMSRVSERLEVADHNANPPLVFDMKKLLDVDPKSPVTFDPKKDLVGLWDQLPIGRTHNVVVDWDNEYILAVGAQPRNQTCGAGLQYIDLADPSKPNSPGCASQDGYVHDAQCVTYNGPDRRYRGRNICIGYNEDTVTVYDSTNKNGNPASEVLSRLSYPGATYCHQGWWTERNWHQYVLLNDGML
jgi:hypothetical protein